MLGAPDSGATLLLDWLSERFAPNARLHKHSGEIRWNGQEAVDPYRRNIGYVPIVRAHRDNFGSNISSMLTENSCLLSRPVIPCAESIFHFFFSKQGDDFLAELTVWDTIQFSSMLRGSTRASDRLKQILV